jgi:outer membrane protein assembly factor BamB
MVMLLVALLAGCDWTSYLTGNSRTGFALLEDGFNPTTVSHLQLAWQASDAGSHRGVFSQPTVTNRKIYWGSFDGYERATDTSGNLLWRTYLGQSYKPVLFCYPDEVGVVSSATVRTDVPIGTASSVAYVGGGDSKVYALDADTGAVLWSHAVGSNPDHFVWSSPAVFGNSVYIGVASYGDCPLVQGQLLQLDRTTGAVQHIFNVVPDGCIGGGVWGSPTIDEAAGTIYFTTGNDGTCTSPEPFTESIVEVRAADLAFVGSWSVPSAERNIDSDFGSTPTLFRGLINGSQRALVGAINKNGIYYTFVRDAVPFGPPWKTRIADGGYDPQDGSGDIASSAFDGSRLYVGGDGVTIGAQTCTGSVSALDPSTGGFVWRHCFTDGFVLGGVTGTSGGVLAVGEGTNIALMSTATGTTLFSYAGAGTFFGPPSIANGTLYEGDMAGNLYALTP